MGVKGLLVKWGLIYIAEYLLKIGGEDKGFEVQWQILKLG